MSKIENFNFDGLCSHPQCNKKYTHYLHINVDGFEFIAWFCEEHCDELESKMMEVASCP